MPRSDRTFPVGPRLLALVVAIAAIALSVPGARAVSGPSQSDVNQAHAQYVAAIAKLQSY